MKLYRVTCIHPHEGTCYTWAGTQAAARQARKEMKDVLLAGYDDVEVTTVPVEIPTKKADLVGWLNTNYTRHNG